MRDTLIGPGRSGLPDGVLVALNPTLADALVDVVNAEITVDAVEDDEEEAQDASRFR